LDIKANRIFRFFLIAIVVHIFVTEAAAQDVRVKLLNGKNGKPIGNSCINLWVGRHQKDALAIPTDEKGIAIFHLTADAASVNVNNRLSRCGLFGVFDPTVIYADTITIQAGYVWCEPGSQEGSWLALNEFSTVDLLANGKVTANACGTPSTVPVPGELTIYVRPPTFWEKLKQ
jgi:hypothetical protein